MCFCRRCQKDAEAKATKRQSPTVLLREAEAMAAKHQSPTVRQRRLRPGQQSATVRQMEAEAKAAKRQSEIETKGAKGMLSQRRSDYSVHTSGRCWLCDGR